MRESDDNTVALFEELSFVLVVAEQAATFNDVTPMIEIEVDDVTGAIVGVVTDEEGADVVGEGVFSTDASDDVAGPPAAAAFAMPPSPNFISSNLRNKLSIS